MVARRCGFNTQPHEGGCLPEFLHLLRSPFVSTHSRTKAAANGDVIVLGGLAVSTHSRTKAAAIRLIKNLTA